MNKHARIVFFLLAAALVFTGCTKKQAPTQLSGGVTGSQSDYGGDFVPESGMGGDYGIGADGLEPRSGSDGISNGMYNGREMVEGVLPSIYFGFDSSSISAAERSKLQQAADYLEQNPSMGLLVEGHCDWYGTAEYNLALGDRRAESVSNYLGTLGITPLRVDKLSKGSLEATSGLSKSQSSEDRRADLILLR
ncbi:OmpA family protein [Coraliomargarita sinensis]|nr:OmpA family protein [Coraliomargarita sinensis]